MEEENSDVKNASGDQTRSILELTDSTGIEKKPKDEKTIKRFSIFTIFFYKILKMLISKFHIPDQNP